MLIERNRRGNRIDLGEGQAVSWLVLTHIRINTNYLTKTHTQEKMGSVL